MVKRSKKRCEELPILHPHAAGIDVEASELFVAVSADRDPHLSVEKSCERSTRRSPLTALQFADGGAAHIDSMFV